MADNFFRVKNGLNLPTLAADPTVTPPTNSQPGDIAMYNGDLYIRQTSAWSRALIGLIGTDGLENGAVTADKLASNAVTDVKVDANAAIAGTKISPDFGAQTIQATTGNIRFRPYDRQQIMQYVASYNNNVSNQTGSYSITLPSGLNTFIRMKVVGYDYGLGKQTELVISCYARSDGSFSNLSAYGRGESNRITRVRYGRTSDNKPVIILGIDGTVISYPSFTISEFEANYNGGLQDYSTGWSFTGPHLDTFYTSEGITITNTVDLTHTTNYELIGTSASFSSTVSGTAFLGNAIGASGDTSMKKIYGYARIESPVQTAEGAGNLTIDCSLKSIALKTGGNASITLNNLAEGQTFTLVVTSTGSVYTLGWSSTIKRPSGVIPTPTANSGSRDIYTFTKIGGEIFGAVTKDMR